MFLLTKFALVTCGVYLAMVVAIDAAVYAMAIWKGGWGIYWTRTGMVIWFGAIWLVSFLLAYRIVLHPLFSRIPKP